MKISMTTDSLAGLAAVDDHDMLTMEYADLVLPLLDGITQSLLRCVGP